MLLLVKYMKYNFKKISSIVILVILFSSLTVFASVARPSGTAPAGNARGPVTTGPQTDYRSDPIAFGKTTPPTSGTMLDIMGVLTVSGGFVSWANTSIANSSDNATLTTGSLRINSFSGNSIRDLCIDNRPTVGLDLKANVLVLCPKQSYFIGVGTGTTCVGPDCGSATGNNTSGYIPPQG